MNVRVRLCGYNEVIVAVKSKLTTIEHFRTLVQAKFNVKPELQRLFYGGKILDDGYTFYDYNIKLYDVIQLMVGDPSRSEETISDSESDEKEEEPKIEYKDAVSKLYTVGDLIDMRCPELGCWYAGRIVRIVSDPSAPQTAIHTESDYDPNKENDPLMNGIRNMNYRRDRGTSQPAIHTESDYDPNKENDTLMKPVIGGMSKYAIENFFSKMPKQATLLKKSQKNGITKTEEHLLYILKIEGVYAEQICKLRDIRPRARNIIDVEDLKIGQKVMLNHHPEQPHERGYWFDFKVEEIVKKRRTYDLIGTIYVCYEYEPQTNTRTKVRDRIFAIEEVIPLEDRTEEYNELMKTETEKRSKPLECLTCRDVPTNPCRDCGCYLCTGKQLPETILLCDECERGFHLECIDPPLRGVPKGDWYCMYCRRDPKEVVAPGASKQKKREVKSNRDWGRGMACAGKTKTCPMPQNHFGPIPGIEVGMCWRFRIQLSESGVHRPPVAGIHGRAEGAFSIVLSGGYEDDFDYGNEFSYTGSGGRDLSGNKRTAEQSSDQKLTRENRALARNCAVREVNENGDDAGEAWREGRPVRVVRSAKMMKHFPKYAPKEGIRYDGVYKVVKYYPEKGKSGFRVWKYLLRRDDDSPAPWELGAKQFDIIYPDGYLEAEAEKMALKEQNAKVRKGNGRKPTKRALEESNQSAKDEDMPVVKKDKVLEVDELDEPSTSKGKPAKTKPVLKGTEKAPKTSIKRLMRNLPNNETKPDGSDNREKSTLSKEEKETLAMDKLNSPLWEECLDVCEKKGKKVFVEHVNSVFLCIICQEVTANPVTTPCLHNFCMGCLKQAFKATGSQACPCCRRDLSTQVLETNDQLKAALRAIMPGYDANRT